MNPRISELFDELDLREIDVIRHSLNPQIPEPWASMSADEIIKGLGVYK